MKKLAYGALALVLVVSCVGLAAAQTIDDIQLYDPLDGTPISAYLGTQVTVEGRIYVVKTTYNPGTHYILDDTGNGINFYLPSAPPLDYGDRVQVVGYVAVYGGELGISSDGGTYPDPVVSYLGSEAEPTPEEMTVDEVLSGVGAEDGYENIGKFGDVSGIITSVGGNSFYMRNVAETDTLFVYIDGDTGINLGAVAPGDEYRVISPIVVYNGGIQLKPRKQGDLIEGSGPVIDDIELDDWSPLSDESVTVTASITDDVLVTSATLHFRDDNGDSTGVFTPIIMTNTVGDTWSGTIPAPHTERQVDFYVAATDGDANVSTNPGDAPNGWYEFAIGFTSIYDVQYRDPSQELQGSDYYDRTVNLTGIVMVGTGDAGASSKFIMQDDAGAFNGILVYEGTAGNFLLAGDEVEVGGYIDEYYGLTEMAPHTPSAVEIISFSNDLYPYVRANTGALNDDTLDDGDDIEGEAYESVWVKTYAAAVTDTAGFDPYNSFKVMDVSTDTLVVDAIVDLVSYTPSPGDIVNVTGFMDYSYGTFELVPLQDEAIVWLESTTGAEDELHQLQPAGGFSRLAPNPFNPKTEIRFVLTRDNLTQLNVYNIRGEMVRTLASGMLESGEHIVHWDGNDFSGQRVSSGTYFARLRIGSEVMQVRKLMLVK